MNMPYRPQIHPRKDNPIQIHTYIYIYILRADDIGICWASEIGVRDTLPAHDFKKEHLYKYRPHREI